MAFGRGMGDGYRFKPAVFIRSDRVWQLLRLLQEAEEITGDLAARRDHLARSLTRIVGGAFSGLVNETDWVPGGRGTVLEFAVDGFDANSAPIMEAVHARGSSFNPALKAMKELALSDRGLVCRREQLVPDKAWYRSDYADAYILRYGYDGGVFSVIPLGAQAVFGAGILRARRDRRFSDEDLELQRMFITAAARLWRAPPTMDPRAAQLPPRLRRIFELYLTGLSEKEVADRLCLSWATVHSYTRDLYRKLGVGSRAQLLAVALRSRD
jgi:DNA-binding CsgD family transcriptional regulator